MGEKYRVWCLDWDDTEEDGSDVVGYNPISTEPTGAKGVIPVPFYNLENGREAAEAYASYAHSHRDGWESSWPLRFRVRLEDGSTQDFEVEREMVPEFIAREVRP
jgi:hypothetical protein